MLRKMSRTKTLVSGFILTNCSLHSTYTLERFLRKLKYTGLFISPYICHFMNYTARQFQNFAYNCLATLLIFIYLVIISLVIIIIIMSICICICIYHYYLCPL